jgi:hypothetical protein
MAPLYKLLLYDAVRRSSSAVVIAVLVWRISASWALVPIQIFQSDIRHVVHHS